MDKISVTMCAYNAQATIEKVIRSVLGQSLSLGEEQLIDLELIVVDDGSTDETLDIIMHYARVDPRVIVFHQENHGISKAREKSIEFVTGDYVAFCDADDWVEPDWLISMYGYAKKYDSDVVRFRALIENVETVYNPNEVLIWDSYSAISEFFDHKLINAAIAFFLVKTKLFQDAHFDTSLRYWEDQSIVLGLLSGANRVVRVNLAKYHYSINLDSLSNGITNLRKVKDSIKVMSTHVLFCEQDRYLPLLPKAKMFRNKWLFSELKGMYKLELRDKSSENQILAFLKESPINTLHHLVSMKDKLLFLITIISPKISRFAIHSLNK